MLDLLADMTLHAILPPEEVEKEKCVILREIDMALDDPDRLLTRALFATAYHEHPLRFPVIGLRPLFEQNSRERLAQYYHARYQPNNMVLAVAGDLEFDTLLELLNDTFAAAPRALLRPVTVPEEPAQLALRQTRLYGPFQSARGLVAWKIPSMRHPDAPALDLIAAILGAGYSGRLRQELRESRELVHEITATAWNPCQPGLFHIQYLCDPDKAQAAEAAILAACERTAREPFTQEELDKARTFATVSEIQSRQTTSGLAGRLGLVTALVGDTAYPEAYFRRIYQLQPADLQAVAARTFDPDALTLATLLPETRRPVRTGPAMRSALEPFEERRLPNGARLLWQVDRRLPRPFMRFAGHGGPAYEPPERRGVTSLMATLLARDTRWQSAAEVARALENKGGFLTEAIGNHTFSLGVEILPEWAGDGLLALRHALLGPAFLAATFERERHAQLAALRELEDDILDFGRLVLRRQFFGDHPLAWDPNGSRESVRRLDLDAVRDQYHRLVVAANSVLVVSGDFDPDQLLPAAEALLGDLPDRPFAVVRHPFPRPAATGDRTEHLQREQAVLFEAFPDCGFLPAANLAGEVLDELLSDMSGPLFTVVREDQSLAYFVGASRLLGPDHGVFYLYAGTQPATTAKVFACFEKELARLRDGGCGNEEFRSAVTRLKVHNRFSLQNPAARAARVARNVLLGKPVMDWLDYEARLDALTLDEVGAFVEHFLVPDQRLRLTITRK